VSPAPDKAQQAMADYLNALLLESHATPVVQKPVLEEKPVTLRKLEQLMAEVDAAPVVQVPVAPSILMTQVVTETSVIPPRIRTVVPAPAVQTSVVPTSTVPAPAIPDWAAAPFQCLLFKVSGLTLAVPLVKLNSVMPWTDKITQTPSKTRWYLGLVQSHEANVKVIDTALMVLPENRRNSIDLAPSHRFSHILLVDNYNWGLACDAIGDVIWLDKHKVKWRTDKTRRPWLAGTVLEQLCAIIDTEVFAQMMNINAGNH